MPLRAIIDGENVLSPFYSDDDWKALKARVKQDSLEVKLPCCGNPGYLRTSKRGLFHFVHKVRGSCDWRPETWQHLKAKNDIALACRDAGYEAITEASGDGWRADVLATKGDNIRIAFEVQWSRQTLEITKARQERYKVSGVRCCWFFKTPPSGHQASGDLPLFKLEVTDDTTSVIFARKDYEFVYHELPRIPLSEFVADLLGRKLHFCDVMTSSYIQDVKILFSQTPCWKCKKPYHVYYMSNLKSDCGIEFYNDSLWQDEKVYFAPEIQAVVRAFMKTDKGRHIQLGTIKKRYSKTVKGSYLSFGCPHCDAICGDWFYSREAMYITDNYNDGMLQAQVQMQLQLQNPYEHWCYSDNGNFCC